MWEPDEELVQAAVAAIDAEVDALQAGQSEEGAAHVASLLEAVGTLVALHREEHGRSRVPPELTEVLRKALATLQLSELDDALVIVLERASLCLTLDPDSMESELRGLLDALRARDRAELLWMGAESLHIEQAFGQDARASRMAFDEAVEGELWQLVPLGGLRTVELGWMPPTEQARFWWRSRGAELPSDALHEPRHFERVMRLFPEAREQLEAVLATMPQAPAKVVDLSAALARRRASHARDERGRLRAAASAAALGAREIPLSATSSFEVSLRDGTLLVDVLDDLARGGRPALVCAQRELPFEPVEGTNQRFALVPGDLEPADWRIRVPFVGGIEEMALDDVAGD
jgi:hypothetical protein